MKKFSFFLLQTLLIATLFDGVLHGQSDAVYETIIHGSGFSSDENSELNAKSERLDSVLQVETGSTFKVFSSSGYSVSGYGNSGYNYLGELLTEADSRSDNYALFWWPSVLGGQFDHLEVVLNLSSVSGLSCLSTAQFEALESRLNQKAKVIIESAPVGTFESFASHASVEIQLLESLTERLSSYISCCHSGSDCTVCIESDDISSFQPLSTFERSYDVTGTSTSTAGVQILEGTNYIITSIDTVNVIMGGTERLLTDVIQDYLDIYGKEITWRILVTGNEVCQAEDQLVVNSFFGGAQAASSKPESSGEVKSFSAAEDHQLYVYLDSNNKLRSRVSTSGNFYHPVDFQIEKLTRLGVRDYPTLSINPSTSFVGPVQGNPSYFAGYTPSGSLISLPFGSVVGFYPGDNGEWPKGSIGAFQTGNRIFWGAWDDTRNKFLGYICKEAINYGDFCDPEPTPTFYLPKDRDEYDEPHRISTIVAASLGYPDTCHILGMATTFTDGDRGNLHVNVSRSNTDLADEIVADLGIPQNSYKAIGIMPNAFCLQSNEEYCRQILSGHKYLEDNNPLGRVLANNPCLVLDFEHVNFQISLGIDEEMEMLKDMIALAIIAPLAAVAFEMILVEQSGAASIRALAQGGRGLTKLAHNYIRQEVADLTRDELVKKAGREFAMGAAIDLFIQSLIIKYTVDEELLQTPADFWERINYASAVTAGASNAILPVGSGNLAKVKAAVGDGMVNCVFNGLYAPDNTIHENFDFGGCARGFAVAAITRSVLPPETSTMLNSLNRSQGRNLMLGLLSDATGDFEQFAAKNLNPSLGEAGALQVQGLEGQWFIDVWRKVIGDVPLPGSAEDFMEKNGVYFLEELAGNTRLQIRLLYLNPSFHDALQAIFVSEPSFFQFLMRNPNIVRSFCEDFAGNAQVLDDVLEGLISIRAWYGVRGTEPWVRKNAILLQRITEKGDQLDEVASALSVYYKNSFQKPALVNPPGTFEVPGIGMIRFNTFGHPVLSEFVPRQNYILQFDDLIGNATDFTKAKNTLQSILDSEGNGDFIRKVNMNGAWSPFYLVKNGVQEGPYTWHHHEDGRTIMPVPKNIHDASRPHIGGQAIIDASRPFYSTYIILKNFFKYESE